MRRAVGRKLRVASKSSTCKPGHHPCQLDRQQYTWKGTWQLTWPSKKEKLYPTSSPVHRINEIPPHPQKLPSNKIIKNKRSSRVVNHGGHIFLHHHHCHRRRRRQLKKPPSLLPQDPKSPKPIYPPPQIQSNLASSPSQSPPNLPRKEPLFLESEPPPSPWIPIPPPTSPTLILKSRLAAGEIIYGPFLLSSSPTLSEIADLAGYDYMVVDTEHSPGGIAEALPCLRAPPTARTLPSPPFRCSLMPSKSAISSKLDMVAYFLLL